MAHRKSSRRNSSLITELHLDDEFEESHSSDVTSTTDTTTSRSKTITEGSGSVRPRLDNRNRGFTSSGVFKFWSSNDEASKNPKTIQRTSSSIIQSSPSKQNQSEILEKIEALTNAIQLTRQERIAWQEKFDMVLKEEMDHISTLETQIADLAIKLDTQINETPVEPHYSHLLGSLVLELDPDLFL